MASLTGKEVGPYHITGVIAEGGMATVYRATDTQHGRTVAIKVLLPDFLSDASQVKRFQREARHTANLQHPHILPVYSSGVLDDGSPYIVMGFAEGGSLADLLERQRGALPLPQTARILDQVAAALDCAHKQGIVHRDVKPPNILMTADGQAMLGDFGIAKVAQESSLTATGTMLGTPVYMAPEQFLDQPVGAWTDIYLLAIVLYEMLTGAPPFQGSASSLMRKQVQEPPQPLTSRNPELPSALDAVIGRALAKEPGARHRTAGELAADFLTALTTPASGVAASLVAGPAPAQPASLASQSPAADMAASDLATPEVASSPPSAGLAAPPAPSPVGPVPSPVATQQLSASGAQGADRPPMLMEPLEGHVFGARTAITLRWQWRAALSTGQSFRVFLRDERGGVRHWGSGQPELQLPDLPPGVYSWQVVVETQQGRSWRETARSLRQTFVVQPRQQREG